MKQHRKALSIVAACVMAVLVAWLGATRTIAQDVPTQQVAASPPAQPEAGGATLARAKQLVGAIAPVAAEEPAEDVLDAPVAEIQADGDVITHWPLQDAPIRQVLRMLAMWSQRNIVATKSVTGTVTTDLFSVTFREALDALLHVNALAYVEKGNFIFVYTAKELAGIEAAQRKIETRVFTLYYVKPEDVVALVTPLLSAAGTLSATPNADIGIPTNKAVTGGNDYAMNDIVVISDYEENLVQIAKVISETDVQPVQVLIEATIMVAKLDEDNALGIDFSTLDGVSFGASKAVLKTALGPVEDGSGLTFSWEGTDIKFLLNAIENITDVNVLANPKLLVVNKQRGEIIVGDEIGYLDSTTRDDSGATTQSVAFLKTGTRLIVRPFVGTNGYIRLEIHPEVSDGGLVDREGVTLPQKQTTECTTNVIVRDGHTIIISGMFRERTSQTRTQVPWFGNIPYIGAGFRNSIDDVKREEVIILLTPRIIRPASDHATSLALQDQMEKFRVGMRQNLNWFGRSRLAVRYLNWAKEHLADGNLLRAEWDLNLTLSLSPAMLEAIELKEYMTGQALWANEAQVNSVRWVVQSMIMNELGKNVNTIIPPLRPLDPQTLPEDVKDATGIGPGYSVPILPMAPALAEPAETPATDDDRAASSDLDADGAFMAACDMVLEPMAAATE